MQKLALLLHLQIMNDTSDAVIHQPKMSTANLNAN